MHCSVFDILPSVNASSKMAYVLWRLERDPSLGFSPHPLYPKGITLYPGVHVTGGVHHGVYPGYAEFGVDVHTLPGRDQEGVRSDVEGFLGVLRQEDPSLEVELAFEEGPLGWGDATETSPQHPIVRSALFVSERVLGSKSRLKGFPGGTTASSFQGEGGIPSNPCFWGRAVALRSQPEREHLRGRHRPGVQDLRVDCASLPQCNILVASWETGVVSPGHQRC